MMKCQHKIPIRDSLVLVTQHDVRAIAAMVHAIEPDLAVFEFATGLQLQDGLFVPWGDFLAHSSEGFHAVAADAFSTPCVLGHDQMEAP